MLQEYLLKQHLLLISPLDLFTLVYNMGYELIVHMQNCDDDSVLGNES